MRRCPAPGSVRLAAASESVSPSTVASRGYRAKVGVCALQQSVQSFAGAGRPVRRSLVRVMRDETTGAGTLTIVLNLAHAAPSPFHSAAPASWRRHSRTIVSPDHISPATVGACVRWRDPTRGGSRGERAIAPSRRRHGRARLSTARQERPRRRARTACRRTRRHRRSRCAARNTGQTRRRRRSPGP